MESDTCETRCAPCYLQGKVSNSYCFCIECLEHLCETCLEQHNKFKVTRSHKVIKGNDMPTDISSFTKLAEIGVCKVHQERRIEYKCLTHHEYACSACVLSTHKSCLEMEEIDKLLVGENEFRLDSLAGLYELNHEVEKSLINKAKQLELFERNCSDVAKQRAKTLDELNHITAGLEHDATEALSGKTKAEKEQLTASIKESRMFKEKLIQSIELANTVSKYGSNQQRTIVKVEIAKTQSMIKSGLKVQQERDISLPISINILSSDEVHRLRSLKTLIEEMLKHETQIEGSLIDDKENATVIATTDVKTAVASSSYDACGVLTSSEEVRSGGISEQEIESEMRSACQSKVNSDSKSTLFESDPRVGSSYACYDISVNDYCRKPCTHIGSILFKNEKMVFIDNSNDILKLISSDFRVISYKKLYSPPYDLALAGDKKVIVAVGKSVRVFSITMDDRLIQDYAFSTKHPVYSICPFGEYLALLYSALNKDTPKSVVQIRHLSNYIIDNIYNLEDKDGNLIELNEPFLIRSRNPTEIIVIYRDRLMVFGPQGKVEWNSECKGINFECITFDSEANMYYCDAESQSIHKTSAKSSKTNQILMQSTGGKRPRSILINSKARTVIVGFEDNNSVQVYKFC